MNGSALASFPAVAPAPVAPPPWARTIAGVSLGWLVAANAVGLWLAASLIWPELGNALAPLSYGRWSALHIDWQLYGWCALPVVGALLTWYLDPAATGARRHAGWVLAGWSLALAGGGVSWLGGYVSGKLFLDWHGPTRFLLPLVMTGLWLLLAAHTRRQWSRLAATERVLRAGLLALLAAVPGVLVFATHRSVYHPINPDSGGATGAAVLGSTIGIVTIFFLVPVMVGVARCASVRLHVACLAASWLVFAALDRGNVSHHTLAPVMALGTLLAWIPLLASYWRRHDWPAETWPWVLAALAWWSVLVVTGWITFLPGVSEVLKFTHALVAHAHLAMAGLLTCVNAMLLTGIARRPTPRGVFVAWQGGCAIYVVSMMALGWAEIEHADALFRSEPWTDALLGVRLLGGVLMAWASVRWWWGWMRS